MAAMMEPVMLPSPPATMMIRRLKVRKKVKSTGEIVVMRWASRPAADALEEGARREGEHLVPVMR